MSRLRVFRQTGWFIAGLMTGLPATAAPAEASSMAGVAVAVATTTPPDATATLQAMQSCRRESAALERLDCYDHLLAPLSPSGFDGALVKAGFVGEAWTRATEQEKRRENGTLLESSRGLSGIDEIKQLFGAKTLTVDTGADNAAGKLTFNIDGLARAIAPLRDACHWAGE